MASSDEPRRPHTISELAALASVDSYDPSRSLKEQLRTTNMLRKQGMQYYEEGDTEQAFVYLARAVNMLIEKLPSHKSFEDLPSRDQKTLTIKGDEILQLLGSLKPKIQDRYDRWKASGGEAAYEKAKKEAAERKKSRQQDDEGRQRQAAARAEVQRDTYQYPSPTGRGYERSPPQSQRPYEDYDRYGSRPRDDGSWSRSKADRDMRDLVAQAAAMNMATHEPRQRDMAPQATPASLIAGPSRPQLSTSPSIAYVPPSRRDDMNFAISEPLALASPELFKGSEYEDNSRAYSTPIRTRDYPTPITTTNPSIVHAGIEYPNLMNQDQQAQGYTPSAASMYGAPTSMPYHPQPQPQPYPTPTASPVPSPIYSNPSQSYPSLHHTQSYSYPQPSIAQQQQYQQPQQQGSYYTSPLPAQSNFSPSSPSNYNLPKPQIPLGQSYSMPSISPGDRRTSSQATPQNVPVRPPKHPISPPKRQPSVVVPPPSQDLPLTASGLRTIFLPRNTLQKFLSIASLNTIQKKETCGLLLGRLKNNAFTVTTLLVPRQVATEDTCTMVEEEMVFEFQDSKDLLTLGWIHTHPTQSCFMSSLDLHTHSGFQSMLPEAFAIVCAPKSTPNFGIFRLTDPPGLQIILGCEEKATFHPHIDAPIYTDADSGHVEMCEGPLEIADLRNDL